MGMQSGVFIRRETAERLLRQTIFILPVGTYKPAPEIFDFMIKDSHVIPSETLFVDDGSSNIHIGKELGFETFQPENGADWRQELTVILNS